MPNRSSVRSPMQLTLAALLGLALVGAGACKGRHSSESKGEVGNWTPPEVPNIKGVPVTEVRTALAARIEQGRPKPLNEDQWRHARALYTRFGGGPLWLDKGGANEPRVNALIRALVDADKDALRLDVYPLPELARAVAAIRGGKPTAAELADADVLLTSAYAALGEDLLTGQVNPRTVSQDWHIDTEEEAIDSALVISLREPDVDRGLARARPSDENYEALRKALVQYRAMADKGGWPTVPAGRALKPGEGDAPARLQALRARLAAEGLLDAGGASAASRDAVPAANAIGGDSAQQARRARTAPRAARAGEVVYDRALAGAVAAYQARHAIVVDSVLGEETVKSMNLPVTYRLAQIAANLERHRWMPRALGHRYIMVNVPAFHLEAWENGERALEMKVIVGQEYEDKKTAVFADTMTTVVFRPYWFITDDIAEKEVWPKVQQDPGYLESKNYETFQEAGKTRIRQRPGDDNSLGLVKFLFPNSFNIYLHDTPEHSLFAKDVRAFSHGCIRLEQPARLAEWVLGWDAGKVQQWMHGKDNQTVKVPKPLPVYITYFTTYAQNGQLHFGNDLYDRDGDMVRVMAAENGQKPEVVQAVEALRKMVAE